MKIGILTTHSQLNYGGILQTLASQTVLNNLGYETVILDRWIAPDNHHLLELFAKPYSLRKIIKFILCSLGACGDFGRSIRVIKTYSFNRKYLKLSSFHFCNWQEVSIEQCNFDCILVGSDQVWNATWGLPEVNLLKNAPSRIPAIGYAISFGMNNIPIHYLKDYIEGGKRFAAISVRERSGLELAKQMQVNAAYVSDPTLLVSAEDWIKTLNLTLNKQRASTKLVVCYFMKTNISHIVECLNQIATQENITIKILTNSYWSIHRLFPKNIKMFFSNYYSMIKYNYGRVQFLISASPRDFLQEIYNAGFIITDSFHALMFATIFKKNVRVLKPEDITRMQMFSRITDFCNDFIKTNIICDSIHEAMNSYLLNQNILYDNERLQDFKTTSMNWIIEQLEIISQK